MFWQFPSGTVRPHDDLRAKLKREIAGETGVDADVRREIGQRIHPLTGKRCVYFECDYISGEARNLDNAENIYVRWVPSGELDAYTSGSVYRRVRAIVGQD